LDVAAGPFPIVVRFDLRDPDGRTVAGREVAAAGSGTVKTVLRVPNAIRWDTDQPVLYTLHVTVLVNGQPSDGQTRRVGFRNISVDDDTILLNGRPITFARPCRGAGTKTSARPTRRPTFLRTN
jgi:beta-galactosidase/beta-glucuronidase